MWKYCSKSLDVTSMILCMLYALLPGYVAAGDMILKIDPRHMVDLQDMPSEITSMLEELGYVWRPLRDPVTGQPVQVIQKNGQYRMLFEATANTSIQINVHIRMGDNVTGLHFSPAGDERPGDAAPDYYRKVRERAKLEFGEDNVSDGSTLFTP